MSSGTAYSTFILNERTSRIFESDRCKAWKIKPECARCGKPFLLGDKIREHDGYPPEYLHFDCWKQRIRDEKLASLKGKEERAKQRAYWKSIPHEPKVYRMKTDFLRMVQQNKGMFLFCPKCGVCFRPGDLWTTQIVNGGSKIIHARCK